MFESVAESLPLEQGTWLTKEHETRLQKFVSSKTG